MSFSAEVKEELLGHNANTRHCQLAGIAAIITSIGYVGETEGGGKALYLLTDNAQVLRKLFTLFKKAMDCTPFCGLVYALVKFTTPFTLLISRLSKISI